MTEDAASSLARFVPAKARFSTWDRLKLVRYICVGVGINVLGYMLYIGITWIGVPPPLAMTALYVAGMLAGYFAHRNITFLSQRRHRIAAPCYFAVHGIGYITNLWLLLALPSTVGIPHQWVQLCAIPIVAAELYLLMNFVVFRAVWRKSAGA